MFQARIPDSYVTLSLTLTIGEKNELGQYFDIKQNKDVNVHLKNDLKYWLDDNCVGQWSIGANHWMIEFENEMDYVNYCLIWNGE